MVVVVLELKGGRRSDTLWGTRKVCNRSEYTALLLLLLLMLSMMMMVEP